MLPIQNVRRWLVYYYIIYRTYHLSDSFLNWSKIILHNEFSPKIKWKAHENIEKIFFDSATIYQWEITPVWQEEKLLSQEGRRLIEDRMSTAK